jgi:Xaa-Pro aminopeptidase
MVSIPLSEFKMRIDKIRELMESGGVNIFLVYGDEYRRENLRYVSNYWPIFERGMLVIGLKKEPILLVSPECEYLAKEMSVWKDIRLIREIGMSYVPEKVEFTNVNFTSLADVINELSEGYKKIKAKVSGFDAMSVVLYEKIKSAVKNLEVENGDEVLYKMRLIKSPHEIEVLKKAWEICDIGYKAILESDIVGLTEIQAAAIGEKAARDAGAEHIVFSIFCSGERTNTIIGRPTEKVIEKNDIIMASLAVQYQGYIATDEWPFVAGRKPTEDQKQLIYHLVKAEDIGVKSIKNGVRSGSVVKKIRNYFRENNLEKYDIYPPIHGNGLAEAESPYPDEQSDKEFLTGMGINFDVSLFGIPGIGSNRIEEGFIVTDEGVITLSKLISTLREEFLSKY